VHTHTKTGEDNTTKQPCEQAKRIPPSGQQQEDQLHINIISYISYMCTYISYMCIHIQRQVKTQRQDDHAHKQRESPRIPSRNGEQDEQRHMQGYIHTCNDRRRHNNKTTMRSSNENSPKWRRRRAAAHTYHTCAYTYKDRQRPDDKTTMRTSNENSPKWRTRAAKKDAYMCATYARHTYTRQDMTQEELRREK
jgi:hypothetical protein